MPSGTTSTWWYNSFNFEFLIYLVPVFIMKIVPQGLKTFFWIYVLLSLKDKKRYIGFTAGLKNRLKEHGEGKVFSTKHRRPLILIYAEGCLNEEDARRREKHLKTTDGRRFLAKRLKAYCKSKN